MHNHLRIKYSFKRYNISFINLDLIKVKGAIGKRNGEAIGRSAGNAVIRRLKAEAGPTAIDASRLAGDFGEKFLHYEQ